MSDPFENVQRGKLKLKGALLPTLGPKKQIKKKKRIEKAIVPPEEIMNGEGVEEQERGSPTGYVDTRTAAEKRYEEQLAKREKDRISKMVAKSHRERIEEFNQRLANLSEHYDIPKVGPG